ncbi:BadF/BadG/BcrA/BcrD ATPase family protein [Streptomyces sp. NPDC094032]|uniref:N-acetylglucosamine kinase n=1 Tax=Streptomyces sp. NPDC094032 TaxID=3155308 RepID=UPI003324C665
MNESGIHYVIGVDAGGTRTRARLAEAATGRVLGEGAGGPGNALTVPPDALVRHLGEALRGALPPGGCPVAAVVGGFAGGGPGGGRERARAALTEALALAGVRGGRVEVLGDADVAFAGGAGAPADGLVLIAGTGAAAARVADRRAVRAADGDGWLLGDAGSGFWLGREALRAVLRALDGRGPSTALAGPVGELCGGLTKEHVVRYAYGVEPVRLAALSPLVVAAARSGDVVSARLLDAAADELAATVRALTPRPGEPLVTTGALLAPGGPLLPRLTARVADLGLVPDPVRDGLAGAVALARRAGGGRTGAEA